MWDFTSASARNAPERESVLALSAAVQASFKPRHNQTDPLPRGGRMTQKTFREQFLPTQGGFETRPYKSPDLRVRRAAALSPSAQALSGHLAAPA